MKVVYATFLLLTVANLLVFVNRDHFQFTKYSTAEELYRSCDNECLGKWSRFLDRYPLKQLRTAGRILDTVVTKGASTVEKVKQIGGFLYNRFNNQQGYPQPIIHRSDPMTQFDILSADSTQKLWCGTWVHMFSFFCWSENIVNRNIEIFKPGDHHMVTECYIPETKKWVVVDLTNGVLLARDETNFLNAQELVSKLESEQPFTILQALNDSGINAKSFGRFPALQHYFGGYPFYYYHTLRKQQNNSVAGKLGEYLLPNYWYEIFSSEAKHNYLFYLKNILILLWLILGGISIIKLVHDRSKRSQEKF